MTQKTYQHAHPTDADWMLWLYDEANPDLARSCESHLDHCEECRAKVETWKLGMETLTQWSYGISGSSRPVSAGVNVAVAAVQPAPEHLKSPARHSAGSMSVTLRYLVAALFVVLAFAAGRGFGPKPDLAKMRSDIKAELRGELLEEISLSLKAELSELQRDKPDLVPLIQTESGRVASATLANWVQQNSQNEKQLEVVLTGILQNQVTLRQDLETLAIQAEAQILKTRRELLRLTMTGEDESSLDRPVSNEALISPAIPEF